MWPDEMRSRPEPDCRGDRCRCDHDLPDEAPEPDPFAELTDEELDQMAREWEMHFGTEVVL